MVKMSYFSTLLIVVVAPMAAGGLVAAYLYLTYFHPQTAFGVFLLPLTLGLIGAGTFLASDKPIGLEPAKTAWGMIHGMSLLAWFAGQALAGLVNAGGYGVNLKDGTPRAYAIADAMLAERAKGQC